MPSPQVSNSKRAKLDEQVEESNEFLLPTSEKPTYINNLPYELLSRVFRNCLGPFDWAMPHTYPTNNAEPFTFLLVCKHWQEVTLQDRFLWTSVAVPAYTHELTEAETDIRHAFIKNWLSRSRELPLRVRHIKPARQFTVQIPKFVSMCLPHWARDPIVNRLKRRAEYHAAQMLDALVNVERQWKSLEIVFDEALLEEFNHACLTYAPSSCSPCLGAGLVRLKISIYERRQVETLPVGELLMWISSLPKLEMLNLKDPGGYIKDLTKIPFGRMKSVKFTRESLRFEEGVLIMSLCTSATDFTLVGGQIFGTNEVFGEDKLKTLPFLKQLTLLDLDYPVEHLNLFTLPALESLEITSGISGCPLKTMALLKDFLDRSRCPIKRLVIEDKYLTAEDAICILRFPALKNVPEVTLLFQDVLQEISDLVIANNLQGPCYHILDGVNFMVWRQETEGSEECFTSGYRVGRKCLDDDEIFQFGLWGDKFVLDNAHWVTGAWLH